MKIPRLLLPALSFILFALTPAMLSAQGQGTVKALRVAGYVELVNAAGASRVLNTGDVFGAGNTIVTSENATALLVLSNGSVLNIQPDSSLEFTELLQDTPPPGSGTFEDLDADPSRSVTRMNLNFGEVIGNAKQLQSNSVFEYTTPVGVAGIRGTPHALNLEISTNADGTQTITLTIEKPSGDMSFTSTFDGETVDIPNGQFAVVSFDGSTGELVLEDLSGGRETVIITATDVSDFIEDNIPDAPVDETPIDDIDDTPDSDNQPGGSPFR